MTRWCRLGAPRPRTRRACAQKPAACVERAVERRQDAARGVRVVHRRAEHEAVGRAGSVDELVHHVVADDATAAEVCALAAGNAVVDGPRAQPEHLRLDALGLQRTRHLRQRHRGVAVLAGASVHKQNLHSASFLSWVSFNALVSR